MSDTRFSILTLGCKLNQFESMGMSEVLEKAGYIRIPPQHGADLYIINTCTVTRKTDRRSRNTVRRVLKWNPDAHIIVTGCSAQRVPYEFVKIRNVSAILGNREKINIVEHVKKLGLHKEKTVSVPSISNAPFEYLPIKRFGTYTRAFVKIQEGCNRNCSYCIIPYVRGPSRSRNSSEIIHEIKQLSQNNFREIVLTGTDLGAFGVDLTPKTSLATLIRDLVGLASLDRVRLSSIEPMAFSDTLLHEITHSPKLCQHFHIPLQSGCDTILRKMNRNYSSQRYKMIIDTIKQTLPDACIGADVIVGFPGESEELFGKTVSFIEKLDIDYLHVFSFSARTFTPAVRYGDIVPPETIKIRNRILRTIGRQKNNRFRNRMIGKIKNAILLDSFDEDKNLQIALTDNYIKVLVPPRSQLTGHIVPIKIIQNGEHVMIGEMA